MAKQSFKFFTPRDKPKKRRGIHTKSLNKKKKLQKKINTLQRPGQGLTNIPKYPSLRV